MKNIFFLFLLALGLFSFQTTAQLVFDNYSLVMQWRPGVCMGKDRNGNPISCYQPINPEFFIHGLWLNDSRCVREGRPFPQPLEKGLEHLMNVSWPSFDNTTVKNYVFWQTEWKRHGSCSEMKAVDYFKQTLDLFDEYRLAEYFKGFKRGQRYKARKFVDAVIKRTRCLPNLSCVGEEGNKILSEVKICLDPAVNPMNCKPHKTDVYKNCQDKNGQTEDVKFP